MNEVGKMREDTVRKYKKQVIKKDTKEKWTLIQIWNKAEKKEVHMEEDVLCTKLTPFIYFQQLAAHHGNVKQQEQEVTEGS